ncbi:MAG: protein-L-isoaspartate(D-aspartate) O-methyltransferase [Candidatus Omnitrophica bacterium]|nr:protein-L-isoaspartate(D-aspartate) O-methyltransferase [Candidatus Omnitrophota bacterium]
MKKTVLVFICFLFLGRISFSQDAITKSSPTLNFELWRQRMVEEQIKARGIKNERVLKALLKVERHLFVPKEVQHLAYEDFPLPIGEAQTISQPYIVALMTELIEPQEYFRVLEIGTGSGYQAAVLAELVKEVYTIEILPSLAERAKNLLQRLGYKNVFVKCADGFFGWPEKAPFDAILVTCASSEVPPALLEQLKEGAKLVIPVGKDYQVLKLLIKQKDKIIEKDILPVRFVPMQRSKTQD